MVDYLVRQGFYVNVDFHSIGFHKTLVTGETPFSGADDYSLYDVPGWTQLWWVCSLFAVPSHILCLKQCSCYTGHSSPSSLACASQLHVAEVRPETTQVSCVHLGCPGKGELQDEAATLHFFTIVLRLLHGQLSTTQLGIITANYCFKGVPRRLGFSRPDVAGQVYY